MNASISTPHAPAPYPVFSQGVRNGALVQVSGQGPADPATGEHLHPGDLRGQTIRTLDNVRAILTAGGADFADVIMVRVYLTKREDFAPFNEVYAEYFAGLGLDVLPARTTVFVGLPVETMLVEIDALAAVR
ncbi:RidA family protein [Microbacterium sp. 179-I 3D4 NHS]|uniref:RidA family protein n=1 Tax=Microbacterium sp. 179-I 3D4 NHS TaxID=3142381 RepID=UPI00399F7ED2